MLTEAHHYDSLLSQSKSGLTSAAVGLHELDNRLRYLVVFNAASGHLTGHGLFDWRQLLGASGTMDGLGDRELDKASTAAASWIARAISFAWNASSTNRASAIVRVFLVGRQRRGQRSRSSGWVRPSISARSLNAAALRVMVYEADALYRAGKRGRSTRRSCLRELLNEAI